MNETKEKELPAHLRSESHMSAHLVSTDFIQTIQDGVRAVKVLTDKDTAKKVKENRKVLGADINAVKLCGHQGIALRGHRETADKDFPDRNKDNFLSILQTIAIYDETLEKVKEDVRQMHLSRSRVQASMTGKNI